MTMEMGTLDKLGIEYLDSFPLGKNETEIIVLRHGEYERTADSPDAGRLTEKGKKNAKFHLDWAISNTLEGIPKDERASFKVLVVASPTEYFGGQRSVETAQEGMKAVEDTFAAHGISPTNILNSIPIKKDEGLTDASRLNKPDGAQPVLEHRIVEPRFFAENPEFRAFLDVKAQEHGFKPGSPQWWASYEEERYSWIRKEMGAEGPDDIGDRLSATIKDLAHFAHEHHLQNPDERLLIIVASHHDTLSPYVKKHILHVPQAQDLRVAYAGGISIHVAQDGGAKTKIARQEWPVEII